ncbi:MAG: hypothetical protein KME26_32155 [Oscillatoria princeps RMCB-10]|jgi:site-specific DNA-methyltransferase (cytosine-N4-specific)|nr:hypothetical protein [Oscillatoria princeps RMCB-10]
MKVDFYWHDYKYLAYEIALAHRELVGLFGREPIVTPDGLSVECEDGWEGDAYRATYFREAVAENGYRIVPLQAVLEASMSGEAQAQNRQKTRYSAHGIHDYRGKFNPQIVRAIGNMLGLKPGDWVLDPFCGSGTTLLEAAHIGWNAIGVDCNPLGVLIARAKIAAISVPVGELLGESEGIKQRLGEIWNRALGAGVKAFGTGERTGETPVLRLERGDFGTGETPVLRLERGDFGTGETPVLCLGDFGTGETPVLRLETPAHAFSQEQIRLIGGEDWQSRVPSLDYLRLWFAESVLVQLAAIMDEIERVRSVPVRQILQVILSDLVREVSLQEPTDLRIRRRKSSSDNSPAIPLFMEAVTSKVERVVRARKYIPEVPSMQEALLGDSRTCAGVVRGHSPQQFDAAITSPPYVTALPYIETLRLSLVLLGLIGSDEIRGTEKSLIGSREITAGERLQLEGEIVRNDSRLPNECWGLCENLRDAIDKSQDGFRRQNVPALLYKYLGDMAVMFGEVGELLGAGAPFALVVGRNKTQLGGQTFTIDTPELLALLAVEKGWAVREKMELDTFCRFDVHHVNSIRSETLLILEKRG